MSFPISTAQISLQFNYKSPDSFSNLLLHNRCQQKFVRFSVSATHEAASDFSPTFATRLFHFLVSLPCLSKPFCWYIWWRRAVAPCLSDSVLEQPLRRHHYKRQTNVFIINLLTLNFLPSEKASLQKTNKCFHHQSLNI